MECRGKLESYLRSNGVPFEVRHHPQAFTAQELSEREHVPGKMHAKVVMVIADGKMVMLALPAPWRVDVDRARGALGAREVRLAREDEFVAAFPDCEVGAMPPLKYVQPRHSPFLLTMASMSQLTLRWIRSRSWLRPASANTIVCKPTS